jgi:alpha-beta hydrolase superfamily lysophospholipase
MTATAPVPTIEPGELIGANNRRLWTGRWVPSGQSRAIVLLVHGYGEHIGRYEHVIAALTGAGYAVEGLDHYGHGRSIGRRASLRDFDHYVDDCSLLLDRILTRDPALPVVTYGHSMGGLIAARLALRRQDDLTGLILSGPAFRIAVTVSPLVRHVGLIVAKIAPDLPIIPTGEPGILSRDPEVERRFAADPLNYHGRARARLAAALDRLSGETLARAEEFTLPLLVMHGGGDAFTDPSGSEEFVQRASSSDKTFIRWPDLHHEIHNEPEQAEVIATLVSWLDTQIDKAEGTDGARDRRHDDTISTTARSLPPDASAP